MNNPELAMQIYRCILQFGTGMTRRLLVEETDACEALGNERELKASLAYVRRLSFDTSTAQPRISDLLFESFLSNNAATPLSQQILVGLSHPTVSINYFREMNAFNWDRFYRDFPRSNGILRLSNIGFGDGEQTALVYGQTSSGPTGTYGYFYQMRYLDTEWKLVRAYGVLDG